MRNQVHIVDSDTMPHGHDFMMAALSDGTFATYIREGGEALDIARNLEQIAGTLHDEAVPPS